MVINDYQKHTAGVVTETFAIRKSLSSIKQPSETMA